MLRATSAIRSAILPAMALALLFWIWPVEFGLSAPPGNAQSGVQLDHPIAMEYWYFSSVRNIDQSIPAFRGKQWIDDDTGQLERFLVSARTELQWSFFSNSITLKETKEAFSIRDALSKSTSSSGFHDESFVWSENNHRFEDVGDWHTHDLDIVLESSGNSPSQELSFLAIKYKYRPQNLKMKTLADNFPPIDRYASSDVREIVQGSFRMDHTLGLKFRYNEKSQQEALFILRIKREPF